VKISELARAAGESIPTLKFFIREGLLPPGERTGKTQAEYGADHLRRLQLIRILQEELGMSLDRVGEVLRSAERGGTALLRSGLEAAQQARHGSPPERVDPELGRAWEHLLALEGELGWDVVPGDPASADAARALATILRVLPADDPKAFLVSYARAMKAIADQEIPDDLDPEGDPWETLRYAVLGTYLYEPLILALRRMAHRERATAVARARAEAAKLPP
jgi:DNA-binding transcriptional MerR regulator